MKFYESNYLRKIDRGHYTILYHELTGQFITFKGSNVLSKIRAVIKQDVEKDSPYNKILQKLIEKGLLYNQLLSRKEEFAYYMEYYVAPNPKVFFYQKNNEFFLTNLYSRAQIIQKLNQEEALQWMKLSQKKYQLKEVKEEVSYFVKKYPNHVSWFQLIPTEEEMNVGYLSLEEELNTNKEEFMTLYLKLTDACNLNCFMCGQAQNKQLNANTTSDKNFLDLKKLEKFLEPVIEQIKYVVLWGGEPLLHRELLEFIAYFKSRQKVVSIATNGVLLEKYAKAFVEMGVDEVVISLDGPQDIHNSIRGSKFAFQQVRSGIRACMKEKEYKNRLPNLMINCTITNKNEAYLEEVLKLSKTWGINQVFYQLPIFITKEQGDEYERFCYEKWHCKAESFRGFQAEYNLNIDKLYEFYEHIKSKYAHYASFYHVDFENKEELIQYFKEPNNNLRKSRCNIIHSALVIEADGRIVGCPDFPDICYGNIGEQTYSEILESGIRKEFCEYFYEKGAYPICKRCCHFM